MTFEEAYKISELNQQQNHNKGCRIILGGNTILNSDLFLSTLSAAFGFETSYRSIDLL